MSNPNFKVETLDSGKSPNRPGPKLGPGRKARALTMVMLRLDGFTVKEIGDWYGCSRQSIESVTHKAGPKVGTILYAIRSHANKNPNP